MHKWWAGCMGTFKTTYVQLRIYQITKLAQSQHFKQLNFVDHNIIEERGRHWMKSESRCLSPTSHKPPFLFALVNIYLFVYFFISVHPQQRVSITKKCVHTFRGSTFVYTWLSPWKGGNDSLAKMKSDILPLWDRNQICTFALTRARQSLMKTMFDLNWPFLVKYVFAWWGEIWN